MKWYRRVDTKLMETSLYNAYVIKYVNWCFMPSQTMQLYQGSYVIKGRAIEHKVGNAVEHDSVVVQARPGSQTG